jgi:hypothetical protein
VNEAAPRPAAFEGWAVGLLCAVTLVCWIPQFRFFWLPNNDYATFEVVARAFAHLELPGNFQRLPLLPAAMALLAPLLPSRHPELDAALLLNLGFALATLPLLYLLAARTLGRGALLVPVLFASATQFQAQALQPLIEPSLCCFVVLAFVLFQRGSPWQYAAAGAAALSRYEAALLFPIFVAANVLQDRRWQRHALLAALGGAPFAVWLALGALRGSGAAFYAADMDRMGFTPAPHVLVTLLKEAYRGWWSNAPGPDLPLFLLAAALPTGAGIAAGVRRFPRETAALLVYLAGTLAVVVGLGIDKARYLHPVLWIPQLFFAAGLLSLLGALRDRLAAAPRTLAALALGAGAALVLGLAIHWGAELAEAGSEAGGVTPDLRYLAVLAALAAGGIAAALRARGRLASLAVIALALAGTLPILAGGIAGKAAEQAKIRWANYGVVVSARWLEQHTAPGERIVAMSRQHFLFLTDWQPSRIVPFFDLEAEDSAALADEMRREGLTWLVATWRKPVAQSIDRVYERKFKWFLVDPFQDGAPVAGFEHVAALPLPEHLRHPPVQIYRVLPETP